MDGNDVKALFAANLKRLRGLRGLSQLALATEVDMATNFINDIEQERKGVSIESIAKIAEALNVEPYELFLPEKDIPEETVVLFERYSDEILKATNKAILTVKKRYSRDLS
jgi:transcriptional regulator with XRE-family HTH domain